MELRQIRKDAKEEKKEIKKQASDHIISERSLGKQKRKYDKDQTKQQQQQLRQELRQQYKESAPERIEMIRNEKAQKKRERHERKRRIRRLLWYLFKRRVRKTIQSLRSINRETILRKYRQFKSKKDSYKQFILILTNSTTLFLLAYFTIYLISQATTILAAYFFEFPVIWYYWEVYFNIGVETWTPDSIKVIYASGPVIALMAGFVFLIIYSKVRELSGYFKLFFLWGFLHSIAMFFGAMLIGSLFGEGLGHVLSWMYVMDTGKLLYSIFAIFALLIAGFATTKSFLISANSYYNELTRANRTLFVSSQVVFPILIGNALLILIRMPRFMFYEALIMSTLIIVVLPVIGTYSSYNDLFFDKEERKTGIFWKALLALILMILIYRVVLSEGIRIGS